MIVDLIKERQDLQDSINKFNAEERKFKKKMAILNILLFLVGSILFVAIFVCTHFLIIDKSKRDKLREEFKYSFPELTVPEGYKHIKFSPYIIDKSGDTLLIEESSSTNYSYATMTKDQRNEARIFFSKRRSKD